MPEALAVTAHHDDAILWMGGTIQRMKSRGWNWTVIAMCVPNTERKAYFRGCCEALGAMPISMGFEDYMGGSAFNINTKLAMEKSLLDAIGVKSYDWVFTHNPGDQSEYGWHANHLEVSAVVSALVSTDKLCAGANRLAYFCYAVIYGGDGRATVARPDARYQLQLSYPELLLKCEWCSRVPDLGNLENIGFPCPNPEAFTGNGLQLPRPFIPR